MIRLDSLQRKRADAKQMQKDDEEMILNLMVALRQEDEDVIENC
jgi:hypothetical protein